MKTEELILTREWDKTGEKNENAYIGIISL